MYVLYFLLYFKHIYCKQVSTNQPQLKGNSVKCITSRKEVRKKKGWAGN